ncbi:hypothetical protein MAE02_31330 [Microvirga aerophila]|uniref:Uncharacterized protein n=1 Tax=Microvirga aerophila TaxID=670291 RepID=A0A512BUG1_9HYPH|nr:hypothetical protein MAE02_31330 [Microvirga aerophila]
MSAHHAAADLLGEASRVADDDASPLQTLDPRLNGGPGQIEPPGRLRMSDASILSQKRNQGTIGGVEHHIDQFWWRNAETYWAFRQPVYGVLQSFAVFS